MRIYGKKNYDELQPLAIGGEKAADSIATLEKLFGVYPIVKDFKEERDRTKDNWDTMLRRKSNIYTGHPLSSWTRNLRRMRSG